MNEKRMKTVLENIAHRGVPENTNLWPIISAQLERKSPMNAFRTRPFVAVMIALLALLALSGAAYALGKALGYIPGLGVVDQNTPFYVLAKPVAQTRDGVTVTVKEAISNADQAYVVFTVEGIPPAKHSLVIGSDTCLSYPELRFPGGEAVKVFGGNSELLETGYESRYKYAPVPADERDAALFIPCIQGALEPGILPENWEMPLHFVPAPPDARITVIPIVEEAPLTVLQEPDAAAPPVEHAPSSKAATVDANPLSAVQVIDAGDSYIFVGAFAPPGSPSGETGIYAIADIALHDANGEPLEWQPAFDLDLTPYIVAAPGKDVWAVKFTKDFVPPVRITYRTQYLFSPASQDGYTFEFDAGAHPQAGQEWLLDQEFQLAGHTVTLSRIEAGASGYTFYFHTADPRVESLGVNSRQAIQIEGYTPVDFGASQGIGSWSVSEVYSEMPKGKLRITLSDLYLHGEIEAWTMDWQP